MTEDRTLDPKVVDRVATASVGAGSLHDVVERLALTPEERQSSIGYLAAAFEYAEVSPGPDRVGVGDYFKPMMEMGGRRYPPALEDAPTEMVEAWRVGAHQVHAPLPRARLNDLCFEGGFGNRGVHGIEAANAYLAVAEELVSESSAEDPAQVSYTHLEVLSRAHSLALALGDAGLRDRVVENVLAAVAVYVDRGDPRLAVMIAELLVKDRPVVPELAGALERIRSALVDDAIGTEDAVRVQLKLPDIDRQRRVQQQRELVDAITRQAEAMEGIARAHHLERAIGEARDAGQQDLVDDLTRQLQAISEDDLELAAFTYGVTIPREKVEQWIAGYTGQATWQDALVRLAHGDPPSGNVDANRETAARLAREHPIQWLATRVRVGGDGLPRFTPRTSEDTKEMQLTEVEQTAISSAAIFRAEVIRRIWATWAPISEEDLTEFFGSASHVSDGLAAALARNFRRFCVGDPEGAAYAAVAHVEAVARELVLAVNAPAYRVQRTNVPGQYMGLGALIPALQAEGLDESWCRFLRTLLSSPTGFNHRNELLHGFDLAPSDASTALTFVAIIYLTKIVQTRAAERESSSDSES